MRIIGIFRNVRGLRISVLNGPEGLILSYYREMFFVLRMP